MVPKRMLARCDAFRGAPASSSSESSSEDDTTDHSSSSGRARVARRAVGEVSVGSGGGSDDGARWKGFVEVEVEGSGAVAEGAEDGGSVVLELGLEFACWRFLKKGFFVSVEEGSVLGGAVGAARVGRGGAGGGAASWLGSSIGVLGTSRGVAKMGGSDLASSNFSFSPASSSSSEEDDSS